MVMGRKQARKLYKQGMEPTVVVLVEQSEQIEQAKEEIEQLEKKLEQAEEKLRTDSSNSSKPPSSDPPSAEKKAKKKPSGRKRGGQPGHDGKTRELKPVEEMDKVVPCDPPEHCECGGPVKIDARLVQRHQQVEIVRIELEWTEHQRRAGICERCGHRHWGELPPGVVPGMLGPRAMATVALMSGTFHLSKRLIQNFFALIMRIEISLGTVSNTEARVSQALEQPVEEAKSFVRQQPVVNADETGHKEAGKPRWAWVAATPLVCAFLVGVSRKAAEAKKLLGESFSGLLISDRYSGYSWIAARFRQVCWSHLQRDLKKISDRGGRSQEIADDILEYIYKMWHLWHQFKAGERDRPSLQRKMKPIRKKVEALLEQGTTCGHPKTEGTCKRILKVREALWRFVDTPEVEPTNNFAERVIRTYVLWRKMCFGTQSERGNRFVERIMTVTASCRLQHRNPMEYLVDAVKAHFLGRPAPSLLPEQDAATDQPHAA